MATELARGACTRCGPRGDLLQSVDTSSGSAGDAVQAPAGGQWVHVEPRLGLAFATVAVRFEEPAASTLYAFRLPA